MKKRLRNGGVLLYTTVLLTITAGAVMGMVGFANQHLARVSREEDRKIAFYAAEAGVQNVLNWFNHPDTAPNFDYFNAPTAASDPLASGLDTDTTLAQGYVVPESVLPRLTYQIGTTFEPHSRVKYLEISAPQISDPPGTVGWVLSTGEGPQGQTRTILVRLVVNSVPDLRIPAAIISYAGLYSNGQLNFHWGEAWSKQDFELPANPSSWSNKLKNDNDSQDPWWKVKTEASLKTDDNKWCYASDTGGIHSSGTTTVSPYDAHYTSYTTNGVNAMPANERSKYRNRTNLLQHQTLPFPRYSYNDIKALCIQKGYPIYRTTASGMLVVGYDGFGNPIEQPFNEVFNKATEFGSSVSNTEIDPALPPPIYFIDTIDGNAPSEDGSNMATLSDSGGGSTYYGAFFMAANFNWGGAGNPPSLENATLPNGQAYSGNDIRNLRLWGLFYSYGAFTGHGQGQVYGAMYADRGYQSGGCPDVYYNWRWREGWANEMGSKFVTQLWENQ